MVSSSWLSRGRAGTRDDNRLRAGTVTTGIGDDDRLGAGGGRLADGSIDRREGGPGNLRACAGGREFVTPSGAGGVEADISAMPPTSIIPAMNPTAEIAAIGLQPAKR